MIAIYEPLYWPGQELQEPAFLPLRMPDNSRPGWREFRILVEMHRAGLHRKQALTGLLSPKFREKTGLTGEEFIAFIAANPGADVYMINPVPHYAYTTYNVWMQGEWAHPGILPVAQSLLDRCGIGWDLAGTPRQGPDTMCYSNFWVASEKFWDDYVGTILLPVAAFLEAEPDSDVARVVMTDTTHHQPTPFLPFIIERLFSTYLSRKRPLVRPYLLDPIAGCSSEFERDIVSFLLNRIRQADRDGVFPPEVMQSLPLLRRLLRRFSQARRRNELPLAPEAIATATRELDREVVFEPLT